MLSSFIPPIAVARLMSAAVLIAAAALLPACQDDHAHRPPATTQSHDHDDHAAHEHNDHDDHNDHGDHQGQDDPKNHEHDHDGHAGHGESEQAHVETVTIPVQAMQTWRIQTQQASPMLLQRAAAVPARVSYDLQAISHAGSLASGRVTRIEANVGDPVKKGQPLVEIISLHYGQLQSDWLRQHAAIAPAQASLEIAQARHQSAQKLYEQSKGIALQQVQQRQAQVIASEQELATARAQLQATTNELRLLGMDDAALATLEKTGKVAPAIVITSPQDGQVIHRNVAMGESISPEHDALFVIADISRLWVLADVPQTLAAEVKVGGSVTIHTAQDEAAPSGIDATIDYLSPQIDPQTRTRQARIVVPRQGDTLLPGMFVRVTLHLTADDQQRMAVPASAVQTIDGRPCVFVPVPGQRNQFTLRPISTGPRVGDHIPVLQGLDAGEHYVSQGSFMLKAELGKAGAGHEH